MSTARMKLAVQGDDAVKAALEGVKQGVVNRVVKGVLRKAASRVNKRAKAGLRGANVGNVRKAVGAKYKARPAKGVFFFVIGPRTGMKAMGRSGRMTDPAKVGHLIEGGRKAVQATNKRVLANRAQGVFFGRAVAAVQPAPFMAPAYDDLQRSAAAMLRSDVPAGIAREAAKYAAKGKSIHS